MPAQLVKLFLKFNKDVYLDAEAVAQTEQRPHIRSAPIKKGDQLELQAPHRVRETRDAVGYSAHHADENQGRTKGARGIDIG
jgi:hypothetical protein